MKKLLRYAVCITWDVIAWAVILFLWACWGERLCWQRGCLAFQFKEDSWPIRTWYEGWGGSAIGHALIFHPGALETLEIDTDLEFHEHFHVNQYEGIMLLGVIIGTFVAITFSPLLGLLLWAGSSHLFVLCNGLMSLLRGQGFYRDATHEQGARGFTQVWLSSKLRESRPPKQCVQKPFYYDGGGTRGCVCKKDHNDENND